MAPNLSGGVLSTGESRSRKDAAEDGLFEDVAATTQRLLKVNTRAMGSSGSAGAGGGGEDGVAVEHGVRRADGAARPSWRTWRGAALGLAELGVDGDTRSSC